MAQHELLGNPVIMPDAAAHIENGGLGLGDSSQPGSISLANSIGGSSALVAQAGSAGTHQLTLPELSDASGGSLLTLTDAGVISAMADPGADRLVFWDDSSDGHAHLSLGTNLSITGTTLNASSGVTGSGSDKEVTRWNGGAAVQGSLFSITDGGTLATNNSVGSTGNIAVVNPGTSNETGIKITLSGTSGLNVALDARVDSADAGTAGIRAQAAGSGAGLYGGFFQTNGDDLSIGVYGGVANINATASYGVYGNSASSENNSYGVGADSLYAGGHADLEQLSMAPADPPSSRSRLYTLTDEALRTVDSAGVTVVHNRRVGTATITEASSGGQDTVSITFGDALPSTSYVVSLTGGYSEMTDSAKKTTYRIYAHLHLQPSSMSTGGFTGYVTWSVYSGSVPAGAGSYTSIVDLKSALGITASTPADLSTVHYHAEQTV